MTSKGKCIFNILLSFMLVLGLIPAISLTSHAVETPAGSAKQNFEVKAQADEVINVKIDVGSGHASLFDETALMNLAKATGASTATINENIITLAGIDSTTTVAVLREKIDDAVESLKGKEDWIIHNKELFGGVGYKPLADYQTFQELSNDIENEKHNNPVKDDLTYYLLWGTAYSELNFGSVNVICGQEAKSNIPKSPAGTKLDDKSSHWYEGEDDITETFEGGKEYVYEASVTLDPDGDYWRCFFDENNLKVSVPDREIIDIDVDEPRLLIIKFKATADHDWDEGKVTKEPTTTAEGEKTYTCKTKGCGATKTEIIPKIEPAANVKIDVGSGHASLFDETALATLANATGASTATINGNIITLAGIDSTTTEDGLRDTIGKAVDSLKGQEDWIIHNKELFGGAGYKPLADYQTYQEFSNDIENEKHNNPVKDDLTYYLLWGTAYSEVNLGSVNVICGQEAESNMPKTPAGTKLDDETSYWYEKGNGTTETFEGGKEYIFKASVTIDPDGDYWGYFFDENNLKVSVPGREVILVDVDEPRLLIIRFKATADHDWDEGKVTKEPTTTAEGVKTYTCKTKGCGATKTEVIPKVEPAPAPVPTPAPIPAKVNGIPVAKMTAKGSTSLTISWNKVQGVEGYDIYFAKENSKGKKASCKLVKTVTGNNTFKWTKSDLKKKTPYKAYVKAYITKDGKKTYVKTSPTIYAYTGNGTKEYTNAKSVTVKKNKVSLKKGKTYKISAKVNKIKKRKKLMPKRYAAALRYMTSDSKVATVSKKGKTTAKGKGTCDIYVYAHNGVHKQIEVTVK